MQVRAGARHIRANEAKLADELLALLDWLPASVALWDSDVRLRYGNRRSLTRFGRPNDELRGAHLSELVLAHAVELSAQYIDGALAGRPQQVERAMVDRDGQRYNAHLVTHVPNIVGGAVVGYCALAVDITASIEGYEHARHAREQAALHAEHLRIAGDIGRQHVTDDLTSALERLDAALDDAAEVLPSMRTAADAIARSIGELRAIVPGEAAAGPFRNGPSVAFPNVAATFDPAQHAGVAWPPDITGRGWSADDVRALLDLLPAEIAIWDTALHNVFANRAAVRLFGGADRAEVTGKHARDLLGAELFAAANVAYAEAALRGEPQQFDRTITTPNGLRHLQLYYAPRTSNGVVDAIYSFVVDVTHRVEAELALQDARAELASTRERERITSDLHKLVLRRLSAAGLAATPAAPIVPQAQLYALQDSIVGALEDLDAALATMHQSVALLDLLPDLAHLVHDIADRNGIAATIENVGSIEYVPPALGGELLAVAQAALSNVAVHAAAHQVVVTVAADREGVWLRVADDGRGIGKAPRGPGMTEMAARAERLGGTCTWRPNEPAGTLVDFRVPLRASSIS